MRDEVIVIFVFLFTWYIDVCIRYSADSNADAKGPAF